MDITDRIQQLHETCVDAFLRAKELGNGNSYPQAGIVAVVHKNALIEALAIVTERVGQDVYMEIEEEAYARLGA